MRAAIVGIGDELVLGRAVDTNAAWLGGRVAVARRVQFLQRAYGPHQHGDFLDHVRGARAHQMGAENHIILIGQQFDKLCGFAVGGRHTAGRHGEVVLQGFADPKSVHPVCIRSRPTRSVAAVWRLPGVPYPE
jgi:hypothetical protein